MFDGLKSVPEFGSIYCRPKTINGLATLQSLIPRGTSST